MEFGLGKGMFLLLLVIMVGCLSSIESYTFYVGGRDGWRTDPSENYIHWAERNRFQINDTLIFRYKKGHDSVLLVTKDDYNKCQKSTPLLTLNDGESGSEFKFDRSGPFYFISGYSNNCERGQKLILLVLSPRTKPSAPLSPAPAPSPMGDPTASSPPAPPTADSQSPSLAPGPAPASNSGGSMACNFGISAIVMAVTFGVLY